MSESETDSVTEPEVEPGVFLLTCTMQTPSSRSNFTQSYVAMRKGNDNGAAMRHHWLIWLEAVRRLGYNHLPTLYDGSLFKRDSQGRVRIGTAELIMHYPWHVW